MSCPLFTIGLTTYNRPELLKQCLQTILSQKWQDFEVVIGNDYQVQPLTVRQIGFDDPRIRIINYEHNLGELGNLNALLELGRGRYVTWMADDDYYSPDFLSDIQMALAGAESARAVFTGCAFVRFYNTAPRLIFQESKPVVPCLLTGREFLAGYWTGRTKAMGLAGVYSTDFLRSLGGAANLANARIAVLSESLALIQTALLGQVIHLDRPLIYSRAHPGSWSCSNSDTENYKLAGLNLLRRSLMIFQHDSLSADFETNLTCLLKRMILLPVAKTSSRRGGGYSARGMFKYLAALERECSDLVEKPHRSQAQVCFKRAKTYLYKIAPVFAGLSMMPSGLRPLINRLNGIRRNEIAE